MIDIDRKLVAGLIEAVEHGEEVRTLEFFEHLVVEGHMLLDINRTPLNQVLDYIRTLRGQRVLEEWARSEAEALAEV